jgi:hypothetical protein
MQTAIGYLRVSTREQGRSGLGLAAQRHEIEAFGAREGFSIRSWRKKAVRRSALVTLLSRAIREGYPPGPERERWLRWLTRIAAKDAAARHDRSTLH